MKFETHNFTYHGEPVGFKTIAVRDNVVAGIMTQEEYVYLSHDNGDPVEFIGDDAAKRAVCLDELINTKIPVQLTLKEVFVLSKLVEDNQAFCKLFGVEGVGKKIDKVVFDRTK